MTVSTFAASLLRQITPPEPEQPPPAVYRYLICRTSDGLILDELPLSASSLPRQIGTDTTTTLSLPLNDPRAGREWPGLVDPRRIPMVVVLRDERPAWGGLITTSRGVSTLDLGAVSLEGWLARRMWPDNDPIFGDKVYEQVDQLEIARNIVEAGFVTGGWGMNVDVGPDTVLSGVQRDRTYDPDQADDCLTELADLAHVNNGFEWTIDLDYTPGDTHVTPTLRLGFPQIGLRAAEPEWRFELGVGGVGGNLVDYDPQIDASVGKFATQVVATGEGEGEARLISAPATDSDWELEIQGLRVHARTAYSTVRRQDTLDAKAEADLEVLRRGEAILVAKARGDLDPRFGQYRLGDDVRVIVEDTARHPRNPDGSPGLDVNTRILGWTLDPSTDQVDLELEAVDL